MTSIPPDPIGAGHLSVSLEFEGPELEKAVRLLQAVAERYAATRPTSVAASPAGPTAGAAAPECNIVGTPSTMMSEWKAL